MSFVKKLFFLGLLMALVLPFVIKTRNGEPVVTPQDIVGDMESPLGTIKAELKQLASLTQELGDVASADGKMADVADKKGVKVYRWRDKNGNWQFSDQENPAGESEIMVVTMAVEADRIQPLGEKDGDGNTVTTDGSDTITNGSNTSLNKDSINTKLKDLAKLPLPLTVSSADLEKMIENAGGMQESIDQYDKKVDVAGGQGNRR